MKPQLKNKLERLLMRSESVINWIDAQYSRLPKIIRFILSPLLVIVFFVPVLFLVLLAGIIQGIVESWKEFK